MALVLKDRVKVTTSTTGTGTLTLGSAQAGFQDFSVIGDGNSTYYTIQDTVTGDFEVGAGDFTASGSTLSRDEVLSSSNAGALVDFGAGNKIVFVTYPADKSSISYYTEVDTTYTAGFSEGVLADTTNTAFTVTLPAAPALGAQVSVSDSGGLFGTNNLTVARNGSLIAGLAEDLVLDISGVTVNFIYSGTTWLAYAQIGGNGGTVVTLDGTQTLTNKTINGSNNTLSNISLSTAVTGTLPVANGGTGATALTGVLKGNGTGAVTASDVNLASEVTGVLAPANGGTGLSDPGTSGNVLTSNGTAWTSAAPSPPPLSAYTLVSETNVSGANTVDFNNLSDEYNGGYMLVLDDVSPSSDNQQLHANYFQNGVLYTGNAIRFSFAELTDNFGFFDGSNENHVRLTGYNRSVTNAFASAGVCGTINFKIQTNTNNPITSDLNYQNVTGHRIISQSFLQISSYFELSGIRLRWHQGGTFASGVIRLYGVNL